MSPALWLGLARLTGLTFGLAFLAGQSIAAEKPVEAGFRFFPVEPTVGPRLASLPVASPTKAGFTEIPAARAGIAFHNTLPVTLMTQNQNLMNGSGVAAGDFDGDGRCDFYFCAINGTNALYRNLGGWRFQEVAGSPAIGCAGWHSTGALFADIDGDGDLDLLVATLGRGVHCFVNEGNGRFTETTADAGLISNTGSTSLAMADVDGDGDLDLYVANYGALSILRSGGRAEARLVNGQWVLSGPHASRLRLVEGRLEEVGEPDRLYLNDGRGRFQPVTWNSNYFLDEEGKPKAEPWDYGLSVQIRDLNGDGWPDIYVCNDFQTPDRIWINQGGGRFRALPRLGLRKQSFSSMGVDFADLDRDGHFDFCVTEMAGRDHARRMRDIVGLQPEVPVPGLFENRPEVARNTLYRNRGDLTFAEVANFSGVSATDWSWQPVFLDVDLDGFEDLLVVNGMPFNVQDRDTLNRIRSFGKQTPEQSRTNLLLYPPLLTPNVAFRNRGDLTFQDVSMAWGFQSRQVSQGVALADLDNDGDLDLAINGLNASPLLYRNEATAPRVAVRLRGQNPNRQGIGSLIRVFGGAGPMQMQEIVCGGYYLSGSDPVRVFAAGSLTNRLTIEVTWRSGRRSLITDVLPNRIYEIDEAAAIEVQGPRSKAQSPKSDDHEPRTTDHGPLPEGQRLKAKGQNAEDRVSRSPFQASRLPLFKDVSDRLGHGHHEELFNDFARQPLLTKLLSQLGPGAAWFDLDNDGHDELVLGTGQGGFLQVYRRTPAGQFEKVPSNQSPTPADLGGLAGWVSADGQRSVLTALSNYESGSTNVPAVFRCFVRGEPARLEINALDGVRPETSSPGPLAVADIDGDGDLDLFVGGRVIPGAYPVAATSRVYRQDGGQLPLDAASIPALREAGLVSGAVWSDLNADGYPELILACEWGPIKIFSNEKGTLRAWDAPVTWENQRSTLNSLARQSEATAAQRSTLNQLSGWWNGVVTGDFDEDGQLDIIATNWGLNDAAQASLEHPLRLYFGDISGARAVDLIEACFAPELGKDVPRRTLNPLSQAFPSLAAVYPTHEAFSTAGVSDVLGVLGKQPSVLSAATLATTLFLNRRTHFVAVPLPAEAQFAPAFAANVADADGDGHEDVFLSQNFFALRMEWPRLDGGRGLWLSGNGKGQLTPIPGQESGIAVYGEQRAAAVGDFNEDGRVDLVVTQNGAATRLYENVGAQPGLRVRLQGPPGNPLGFGAILRLQFGQRLGPAREVHGGAGYWSQDSPVQVLGCPEPPSKIHILWPGGKNIVAPVPQGSREIVVDLDGNVRSERSGVPAERR